MGSKITADGDCSHEIKRRLLLGRVMTNLDSIFKSRDITLPTKVRLVKAAITIYIDFGAQKKIKSDTVSTVSPSISHEVMGPDAMIFVF